MRSRFYNLVETLFSETALETAGTVTLEEMSTVTEAKQEKVGRQQGGQAEDYKEWAHCWERL